MASAEPKTEVKGRIIVYSVLGCPHCMKTKKALHELDLPFTDVRLDLFPHLKDDVMKRSGVRTVPQIYFNEVFVGGNSEFNELRAKPEEFKALVEKVRTTPPPPDAPVPPDPSQAVEEADPYNFECEPDELFILVNELRKEGIPKKKGFLFSQKNAFTGEEFVTWVKKHLNLDDGKATQIGQILIDRMFIRGPKSTFTTGTSVYTLLLGEDGEALNSGPMSECVPKTVNELGEQLRKMILKLYAGFLSQDGRSVDYKGMKSSEEFQTYKRMTRELLRANIKDASREEKLAFFINIYNALVIHANVERGPPTTLWGRYKFFNSVKYIIGSHTYSLQDMENGVLRANRKGVGQLWNPFDKNDPRLEVALERAEPLVHFGLVCGAKSCPPIKTYTAGNIYEELSLAATAFLDNPDGCQVDVKNKTLSLSSIFKWYHKDFGRDHLELAQFVLEHMGAGAKKEDLKKLLETKQFRVSFLKYDWSSNSK